MDESFLEAAEKAAVTALEEARKKLRFPVRPRWRYMWKDKVPPGLGAIGYVPKADRPQRHRHHQDPQEASC